MGTINAIPFVSMRFLGGGGVAAQTIVEISRPGINGNAFLQQGTRGEAITLETMTDAANAAGVATAYNGYRALKGQRVPVVDDLGNSFVAVVLNVEKLEERAVALFSGGSNGSHVLRARWTLVPVVSQ
jgi:hypothetical protein